MIWLEFWPSSCRKEAWVKVFVLTPPWRKKFQGWKSKGKGGGRQGRRRVKIASCALWIAIASQQASSLSSGYLQKVCLKLLSPDSVWKKSIWWELGAGGHLEMAPWDVSSPALLGWSTEDVSKFVPWWLSCDMKAPGQKAEGWWSGIQEGTVRTRP